MRLKRLAQGDMKTSGKYNDTYWKAGIRLPNCTLYCLLRLWEQGMKEQQLFTYSTSSRAFPNAQLWYTYWKGKKGTAPKVGCPLVWGGNGAKYGHVAICEDILEDNGDSWLVQVSQSNYGGTYFEYKEYTIKKGVTTKGVGMPYIGCCYVDLDLGQAQKSKRKHQAQVDGTNVISRKEANGTKISGMYTPMGYYNVIASKDINGSTWVKVGTNDGNEVWCGAYTDLPATVEDVDLNSLIVPRDTSRHQVEITGDIVRARDEASLNGEVYGYMPKGVFNVYETKTAEDLVWYRVGTNVWTAYDSSWAIDYKAEDSYEQLYNAEVKKYQELEKTYNALNSKYNELNSDYNELKTKVTNLENTNNELTNTNKELNIEVNALNEKISKIKGIVD